MSTNSYQRKKALAKVRDPNRQRTYEKKPWRPIVHTPTPGQRSIAAIMKAMDKKLKDTKED